MTYTPIPVDTSASPVPLSHAVPDGTNTPLAIAGGPSYVDTGNTKVPVSMYVKDGNNLVEGATTDAAVTGDTAGSLSAKLRGLSKIIFDIWDSTNHLFKMGGAAASGATQAGNPVKVGGVFNTTQPTVTNGQAVDAQATARGAYIVATGIDAFTVQPGNTANTTAWKVDNSAVNQPVQFANVDVTALASAGRTTTQTVTNLLNKVGRGIRVTLDMTTVGTGSVTLTINAKDAVSGKTKLLLAGAAVTTNVTNVYIVYPGYAAVANVSANDVLSATFELVVTANNANTATYSLGYCILL